MSLKKCMLASVVLLPARPLVKVAVAYVLVCTFIWRP